MNIKIKKKILVCMLWLCAIACFTGFPWIFFSWDVIHSYMGIHDIPSDLTIVLFREECLFFGFFCIYFLFLRNIEKYSDYPFMHLLYSQLLVCQRVCLQNTVCLICK